MSVSSILQTLKTCVDKGREAIPPQWHRRLKTNWWSKMVPYFLYACSCGSLDAVKYFIDSGREPNIRYTLITAMLIVHVHVSLQVLEAVASDEVY